MATSNSSEQNTSRPAEVRIEDLLLPNQMAESLERAARRLKAPLVPHPDQLEIGDVILCRRAQNKPHHVETHQRTVAGLESGDAATWTHAMLYVGRMHVAESTNFFKVREFKWRTGVRVHPLVVDGKQTQLLICRRKSSEQEMASRARIEAANYALADYAIKRRVYGFERVVRLAIARRGPLVQRFSRLFPASLDKAIICSEYVLECLAIGGQMFVEDWLNVDEENVFYPGSFFVHSGFDHLDVTLHDLSLDPHSDAPSDPTAPA